MHVVREPALSALEEQLLVKTYPTPCFKKVQRFCGYAHPSRRLEPRAPITALRRCTSALAIYNKLKSRWPVGEH